MVWSKAEELKYWNAENVDYYLNNLRFKRDTFEIQKYFDRDIDLAIDIGGGKFGGALYYFQRAKHKILVDALAKHFRIMKTLPNHIDSITAEFSNIPLKDCCADVIFTWNVFDHANSPEHFFNGLNEANRLLKMDGLWFGSFPLRKVANENHPICIEEHWLANWFLGYKILSVKKIGKPHYRDETIFLVARKKI